MSIASAADILIPAGGDMTRWSCVACDQFTAEPDYWAEAGRIAGDAPSTLRLMLPETYLDRPDAPALEAEIPRTMARYLSAGVFREVRDSFVYVERTLPSGALRRGLVAALELEAYDWGADTSAPIRATEDTVESRLPARVRVRRQAPLEMPHILVFIDDPADTIIPGAAGGETLYDFDLMLGGGHLRGERVCGAAAARAARALDALGKGGFHFAVGDGNHSLAAAKRCWETLRTELSPEAAARHPARRALAELVNIHDPAVTFEPIHRVLFGTDPVGFLRAARAFFPHGAAGHRVTALTGEGREDLVVPGRTIGEAERFCRDYVGARGGTLDYIHGGGEAAALAARPGNAGLLLPRMEKAELFSSVAASGPFPRKSFSIGEARDKRYYLECRKIR